MESKKINQLATELTPALSDLTIIGDPTTGISKKITLSQMASLFTGTVEEYPSLASFPLVGVADTIYIALDTNVLYRWNTGTSAYVELSPNIINSLVFSDANGFDGNISLVGSVATLTITTALTQGSVPFIGTSGALTQDNANLFFDDTNNRLGINTNAPTTALDVFGSGIIGRLNGTSTNNSFLGFANAGTNRWSIGNVQSDHRFRIYSETNTSELVSVLQTGEFGIGIANPTTKIHIDGGATALIANLDANVSVAKSISFRSDNSNRINIEVSGTESGSNAGANFFLRTYTDAGSLLETPLSIVRSTGVTTLKSLTLTNALSVANGGTGSTTQNFVDLTTTQSIGGAKTFTSQLTGTSAIFSGNVVAGNGTSTETMNVAGTLFLQTIADNSIGGKIYGYNDTSPNLYGGGLKFQTRFFNGSAYVYGDKLTIASNGAATFSFTVQAATMSIGIAPQTDKLFVYNVSGTNTLITAQQDGTGDLIRLNGNGGVNRFNINQSGTAVFNVNATGITINDISGTAAGGIQFQNNGTQKFNFTTLASTNDLSLYNNGGTNSYNLIVKHSTGNLLIGTTTDNGLAKIQTTGNITLGLTTTSLLHAEGNVVSTSTVQVATNANLGVGAFYFVVWYNSSGGAQGKALLMASAGRLTTISIDDNSGLGVIFSLSGATLFARTTSGTAIMSTTQMNQ